MCRLRFFSLRVIDAKKRLGVDDVLAFEALELVLDLRGFIVGARHYADGDAALAEDLLVGLGIRFGDAKSDKSANETSRYCSGPAAGESRGNRTGDQADPRDRNGGANREYGDDPGADRRADGAADRRAFANLAPSGHLALFFLRIVPSTGLLGHEHIDLIVSITTPSECFESKFRVVAIAKDRGHHFLLAGSRHGASPFLEEVPAAPPHEQRRSQRSHRLVPGKCNPHAANHPAPSGVARVRSMRN